MVTSTAGIDLNPEKTFYCTKNIVGCGFCSTFCGSVLLLEAETLKHLSLDSCLKDLPHEDIHVFCGGMEDQDPHLQLY